MFVPAEAYVVTGVGDFSFGTLTAPFTTASITTTNGCISLGLLDSINYRVRLTSAVGGTSALLLQSGANTMPYHAYFAAPTNFIELTAGGAGAVFNNPHGLLNPCPGASVNISLRISLLSADLAAARAGNYSDTLSILFTSS